MKKLMVIVLLGVAVGLTDQVAADPVGSIAFDYCEWASCAVVIADADGSNPLAVAEGTAPVWSPDGSRIAFLTTFVHDCDWQDFCVYFTTGVLVLDLRGGTTANLTRPGSQPPTVSDPGTSSDWSPTWSPDGAKVAFVRDYALYVSNVDGSGTTLLTDVLPVAAAAWSPDGGKILFTCITDLASLCHINADGSGMTHLTADGFAAAWSLDGARIVFATSRYSDPGGSGSDIAVMNPDGTGITRLTRDCNASGPTWSPDGTRVAFAGSACNGPDPGIWIMNADGTDQHCLVGAGRAWFGPWIADHPAWAPGALARASASPTITYAPISIETPVSANSAVTVTATITSDVGVTEAILFYRDSISVIWGGDYTPVPLTRSGVTYSGTMPTGDVEYYIEARDAHGNISRAPWGGPFVPYWVWVAW